MRIEAFRETIGGIDVVDAEFADRFLLAVIKLREKRRELCAARHGKIQCRKFFGRNCDEWVLWSKAVEDDTTAYAAAWRHVNSLIKQATATK